jgi:hypothetical protein
MVNKDGYLPYTARHRTGPESRTRHDLGSEW